MNRNTFLKTLLGSSTFMTMDGFSTIANALSHGNQEHEASEFATYGAIHLNITNLQRTTEFWTKVVGMQLRSSADGVAELGTETTTLVIIHETAKTRYQKGFSGLYHVAIHAPNIAAFAGMVHRLNVYKYPYSPIDHTMSKSVYLDDPDGINIEFTLETPERFKRVVTTGGLKIEGADGIIRSASERLNVAEVLKELKSTDTTGIISDETYIGHLHLYANHVANSNAFYRKLGYVPFNFLPQFMYADLGTGGHYQHRIAMNSWHGQNRPLAPEGSAGMRHFQINYTDKEKLNATLANVESYEECEDGYWLIDPTGNKILITDMS